jgi:hypothetical protein
MITYAVGAVADTPSAAGPADASVFGESEFPDARATNPCLPQNPDI